MTALSKVIISRRSMHVRLMELTTMIHGTRPLSFGTTFPNCLSICRSNIVSRYNGRPTQPPSVFPKEMEEACKIIEEIVCAEIKKRKPYPLEWGGRHDGDPLWRANVAASNCYRGTKESVGFHSDQVTYLGPYPTIASLSLGTYFSLCQRIGNSNQMSQEQRVTSVFVKLCQ